MEEEKKEVVQHMAKESIMRMYVRRQEERAKRKEGRLQNEEVQEKRSGVWRWQSLEEEDVQRVCLTELPMVGFPVYRLAL